jgi:hypothetical protein
LHEAIHADHAITDLDQYMARNKDTKGSGAWENREEMQTIQEVNAVAKQIPTEPFQQHEDFTRSDHLGIVGQVVGSVTSKMFLNVDRALIDKTRTPSLK